MSCVRRNTAIILPCIGNRRSTRVPAWRSGPLNAGRLRHGVADRSAPEDIRPIALGYEDLKRFTRPCAMTLPCRPGRPVRDPGRWPDQDRLTLCRIREPGRTPLGRGRFTPGSWPRLSIALLRRGRPTCRLCSTSTPPTMRCTVVRRGGFFHGYYDRLIELPAARMCSPLRPAYCWWPTCGRPMRDPVDSMPGSVLIASGRAPAPGLARGLCHRGPISVAAQPIRRLAAAGRN